MKAFFKFLWGAIKAFHVIAASILLVFIYILLAGVFAEKPVITVPEKAALLFAPEGVLVEKRRELTINDLADGAPVTKEVVLRDAVRALAEAKVDPRIAALVLDLDDFLGGGPAALHRLGAAIEDFKASGKPVFAIGDNYSQAQYLLAAHADKLWMNPMGGVDIRGYAIYVPHFASALKKLRARVHVFRVGTYKSAVEPFIRDDMSPAAKEANRAFLNLLWDRYVDEVTRLRGLEDGAIERAIAEIVPRMQAVDGDSARFALSEGWVDELRSRDAMRKGVAEVVGSDANTGFRQISYTDYLKTLSPDNGDRSPAIAVITLRGAIVPGKAPRDQIGSENALALIARARRDSGVKAVVIRVDSPGGSAFASEIIRQAILDLKESGKPVVISMGSVAASGGYWISTAGDEIWAAPETVTGSIGIFGLIVTFEDSLDALGVHTDGIGTTPLAGAFDPTRGLDENAAALIQTSIENGYHKFLERVAESRGMTPEDVDRIAQGRVWAGETARELGLVDHLGTLADAVAAAAARVDLAEGRYGVRYIEERPSRFERILMSLKGDAEALGLMPARGGRHGLPYQTIARQLTTTLDRFAWLHDPQGTFALCLDCEAR